jgi:Fe-S-cluster-containing dehydrogenase component
MIDINRRLLLKAAGISMLGSLLPPVGYFSQACAQNGLLDPVTSPVKRWGMTMDMVKCPAGCQDCIDACHNLHNVPTIQNPGYGINWIQKVPFPSAFPSQENPYIDKSRRDRGVIVLCNHCSNPPCVRVCPTKATFKRNDGIVMMDYHRCIGCRFCIAACPYGARSMNFRDPRPFIKSINPEYPTRTRGVVEKCNFCDERLARNLPPACVAACKNKALVFGDLEKKESDISTLLKNSNAIRRRPELGTDPHVFYIG